MQLYVINWSFQNAEDQLFATNEFCEKFKKGELFEFVDNFELITVAHIPQNGSGTIICKAHNSKSILNMLKAWRENYSISFNINPALSNEEFIETYSSGEN